MHSAFQRGNQRWPSCTEFDLMVQGEFTQQPFALWSQVEQDLTPVFSARVTSNVTGRRHAIYQLDRAVVLDLQPFRQFRDPGPDAFG